MNFKRYKLSTLLKKNKFIGYKFSKLLKAFQFKRYDFTRVFRIYDLKRYNFKQILKIFNFRRFNFNPLQKIFNLKKYNPLKIIKLSGFKLIKRVSIYFLGILISSIIIYLSIPLFFNYDKLKVTNTLCKDFKIECSIKGKIKYTFFPTPRIKLNNFVIKDYINKAEVLADIKNVEIKLSLHRLISKNKINYTKLNLKNVKINLNLANLQEYSNINKTKINLLPIVLTEGQVNFYENERYLTSINNVIIKYNSNKKKDEATLKGIFLGDKINISFKNKKKNKKISKTYILKLLNSKLFASVNILRHNPNKKYPNGNFLFKTNKNRLAGIFDYKDNQIIIKNAKLRNSFLDGGFDGVIKFLPFFDFNLNIDLKGMNFNKFNSFFSSLNKENLFNISNKINGQINLSVNKIYSKYNLIESFESRIRLINSNISVEQLLLNLGKLGAADITGLIKKDEKFVNFSFENNIFIDNSKRFYSKFGIYNKKNNTLNLFVKGNLDLLNLNMRFQEISSDQKLGDEDLIYIENEFNNTVLKDGYNSFFNYLNFKEFAQTVLADEN